MRYAVIADIHGNLPALEAVLKDVENTGADKLVFLGALIADFPWPCEVVDFLRQKKDAIVLGGNREKGVLRWKEKPAGTAVADQFAALYWNFCELSDERRSYLEALPDSLVLEDSGVKLHLAHAPETHFGNSAASVLESIRYTKQFHGKAGFSHDDYLRYADGLISGDAALAKVHAGVYLFGHYHTQWFARCDKRLFLNPGAVGLSTDGDTGAPYTILEIREGRAEVLEKRVPYDIERAVRGLCASPLYRAARIWSEINILSLRRARQMSYEFFDYVERIASERGEPAHPFSDALWNTAGQAWLNIIE